MANEIIVAIIAFFGTAIGTGGGIMASSKLTNFRLIQLEKKVDKHNSIIERTYIIEEKIKSMKHKINDLEGNVKK